MASYRLGRPRVNERAADHGGLDMGLDLRKPRLVGASPTARLAAGIAAGSGGILRGMIDPRPPGG